MSFRDPFHIDPDQFLHKQLYLLNLDSKYSADSILKFINSQYLYFIEREPHINRRSDQTDNLAYYLGYGSSSPNKDAFLSDSGPVYRSRSKFIRLRLNHLKDIVDNLVSRFAIRKPNFIVYPKNSLVLNEKSKAKTARKFLISKVQENKFEHMAQRFITDALVFAESYLEVFWDVNAGPNISETSKEIPLMDTDGSPMRDEHGEVISVGKKLKLGDVSVRLWDPRQVITSPAEEFDKSEWVILFDYLPVEKLRARYPERSSEIRETDGLSKFDSSDMSDRDLPNSTIYYKLYHRPTPEMPEGRIIEATPDVVLRNDPYPHKEVVNQDLFPVVQLRPVDSIGTERGLVSVVSKGKGIQLAINNLVNIAIRNLALFPPMRVWEAGSVDKDKLNLGIPTDITYKRNHAKPDILTTETVPQNLILMINMLTQRLMQLSNVFPTSRGETVPNTESRLMLDFMKDQELAQSLPMDDKVKDALVDISKLWLAIAASEYQPSEMKKRLIRFIGERNSITQEMFDIKDLQIPFDIKIEVMNTFSDTFQGRINQIQQIMQIPGIAERIPPAKLLDVLEIGGAEDVFDSETAAIDLANREIGKLLDGKEVASPQKYIDLVPYYREYLKLLQRPEIREILPDVYDSNADARNLRGTDAIAQRLMDQVAAAEMLILEAIENAEAMGVVDPQTGVSTLRLQIMQFFPSFPAIYQPEAIDVINPLELEEQALPEPISSPEIEENSEENRLI